MTADDLLTAHPERVPARPRVGIVPKISDAEVVTLAAMQALLGYLRLRTKGMLAAYLAHVVPDATIVGVLIPPLVLP